MDIVKYLQEDKKLSVDDIAKSMGTTVDHIENVISKKETFTANDLKEYLEFSKFHFWEFAIKAIPLNHLSEKAKNRVLLCQQISAHINKKMEKSS